MIAGNHTKNASAAVLKYMSMGEYVMRTEWAWIPTYALPIVMCLGVLGNSTTFVAIMCRRLYLKSAVFVFFAFISFNDLMRNLFRALVEVVDVFSPLHPMMQSDSMCAFKHYTFFAFSVTSAWILVTATLYKLYVIRFPFDVFKRETVKTSAITCTAITAILYLFYTHIFWVSGIAVVSPVDETTFVIECFYKRKYAWFRAKWFPILDLVSYSLVPGLILVLASVAIAFYFLQSYRTHKTLSTNVSPVYKETKKTVLMLLPVSTLFILTSLPLSFCTFILQNYYPQVNATIYIHVLIFVGDINHSLNAYLQFAISSAFRNAILGRET